MMSEEFRNLFYSKLSLNELSPEEQSRFIYAMNKYLDHGRTGDKINGRTIEFIEDRLNNLINLFEAIGLTSYEMVRTISNFPSILNNIDELYNKYVFLGLIENEENTFRKNKLINKTRDFMTSYNTIIARYTLACYTGYNNINWNLLVHSTDSEFASIFIFGTYKKPYQRFLNEKQVNAWLATVDINSTDLEYYKNLKVNEELVSKYEGKSRQL